MQVVSGCEAECRKRRENTAWCVGFSKTRTGIVFSKLELGSSLQGFLFQWLQLTEGKSHSQLICVFGSSS